MTLVIVIAVILVVSGIIVKFYPKSKTVSTSIVDTPFIELEPSIHEELAKTVAEFKAQLPVEAPKKKTTKKPATKAKMSAKKKPAKKTTKK